MAVANLIVGQQIKFVDGHACSGSSIPASDVYADNNVLMMSPASTNPALTEKGYPTIMRIFPRDDAQGAFIAPWIAKNFEGKKIAILHDKAAYGKGLATVVKDTLNKLGVQEVMFEGINPGEKDYSAIVSKLKAAGVEFLYYGGYHAEAGLILRQAADQGYKFQLMSGDGLATAEFWPIAGPAGEGTLFTFAADPRRSATPPRRSSSSRRRTTIPKASRCSPTASSRRSSKGSSAPARTIRSRSPRRWRTASRSTPCSARSPSTPRATSRIRTSTSTSGTTASTPRSPSKREGRVRCAGAAFLRLARPILARRGAPSGRRELVSSPAFSCRNGNSAFRP